MKLKFFLNNFLSTLYRRFSCIFLLSTFFVISETTNYEYIFVFIPSKYLETTVVHITFIPTNQQELQNNDFYENLRSSFIDIQVDEDEAECRVKTLQKVNFMELEMWRSEEENKIDRNQTFYEYLEESIEALEYKAFKFCKFHEKSIEKLFEKHTKYSENKNSNEEEEKLELECIKRGRLQNKTECDRIMEVIALRIKNELIDLFENIKNEKIPNEIRHHFHDKIQTNYLNTIYRIFDDAERGILRNSFVKNARKKAFMRNTKTIMERIGQTFMEKHFENHHLMSSINKRE